MSEKNKLAFPVLAVLLLCALAGSASASMIVSLTTPDFNNQSAVTIAFNFTAMSNAGANITNATLYGNFSGAWGANVTNTSIVLFPSVGYVFNVTGIPEGTYVWNVQVGSNETTNLNFSSANQTLTVDRTKPQLKRVVSLNNSFALLPLGLNRYYFVFGNATFRVAINNSFTNSSNTAIQSVNITYNDSYAGNMGVFNGTNPDVETLWNVTVNLSSARTLDGPANLTINITDYAGNSEVATVTRISSSSFQSGGSLAAGMYINNFPNLQVRVFNPASGKALNSTAPGQYNVTVRVTAEGFGVGISTFSRDFGVNADGEAFVIVNDSAFWQANPPTLYRITMFANGTNGNVSFFSNSLPPQPVQYMAAPGRPRGGLNIYAAPAVTLAFNISNGTNCTRFFGMVQDANSGQDLKFFQNASDGLNADGSVNLPCRLVEIVVPANRNYSVTFGNPPENLGSNGHMFPPRNLQLTADNISDSDTTDFVGVRKVFQVNTSFSFAHLYGNLTTNSSATSSYAAANYTQAFLYMLAGNFLPPMTAAKTLNNSLLNANGFNFSTMPTGTSYLIVVYGNQTTGSVTQYFMGVANVTSLSADTQINVTLRPLAGTNRAATDFFENVTTNRTRFNFVDENGSATTAQLFVEAVLNYSTIYPNLLVRRQLQSQGNGLADISLLQGMSMRIRLFSPRFAPIERTYGSDLINNNATINITVKTPEFRKPREGGVERAALSTLVIDMYESNSTCNVPEPDYSCNFASKFASMRKVGSGVMNGSQGNFSGGDFSGGGFDPMENSLQGRIINMRVFDSSTNTTIYMMGLDMSSMGQPNMEMDSDRFEKRTGGGKQGDVRRFGSQLPSSAVKEGIWIGTAYNESEVNESAPMNASIPYLYDDDGNLAWNASVNTSAQIPERYIDYVAHFNTSKVGNASMLANITCQDTFNSSDSTQRCYRNTTTNIMWLKIPHFSTIAVSAEGSAVSSSSSSSSSTSPSGSGSSGGFTSFGTIVTSTATPTASAPAPSVQATATPLPSPSLAPTPSPTASQKEIAKSSNSIASASNLLATSKSAGNDASEAERLLQLARQYQAQGNYQKAYEFAERARQLLEGTAAQPTPQTTAQAEKVKAASTGADYTPVIAIVLLGVLGYAAYAATIGAKKN